VAAHAEALAAAGDGDVVGGLDLTQVLVQRAAQVGETLVVDRGQHQLDGFGPVGIHFVGANGPFRAQGKARRRRQWLFHDKPSQRRHAPGKGRSLRVAAKSAGCVVALLAKGVAIGGVARLAVDAFGHNASDKMNANRPIAFTIPA
jgi:hypothetical protein